MTTDLESRAIHLAEYIIEHQTTVRAAAARFGVSKSTVHKDVTERLERLDRGLWVQAKAVLEQNKAERHLRGGEATRARYAERARHTKAKGPAGQTAEPFFTWDSSQNNC